MELKIATRGSALALVQAGEVKEALERQGLSCVIKTVRTRGDADRRALREIGGNGLFVREIENELLSGDADVAVHSAKDLPFLLAEGLTAGGVLKAEDPRDCLVTRKGFRREAGRPFKVGTGSPRRRREYASLDPDAVFSELRGNVTTRLRKLADGEYDGIILAMAGLNRLGADLSGFDVRAFRTDEMVPAACQGILALECRADDVFVSRALASVTDEGTMKRFRTERELFRALGADCASPAGIHAEFSGGRVRLSGMYGDRKAVLEGKEEELPRLSAELLKKLTGGAV